MQNEFLVISLLCLMYMYLFIISALFIFHNFISLFFVNNSIVFGILYFILPLNIIIFGYMCIMILYTYTTFMHCFHLNITHSYFRFHALYYA